MSAASYKTYSQSSRSSAGSHYGSDYGQYPVAGSAQGHPSYYYPTPDGGSPEYSQYPGGSSYTTRPSSSNSQRRTYSSESVPRAATYPPTSADSERAAKRQRGSMSTVCELQPAWVQDVQGGGGGDPRYLAAPGHHHHHHHGAHAYPAAAYPTPPSYSQQQQHSAKSGSLSPPSSSYLSQRRPSSERSSSPPDQSQHEPLDHGPTELPPRTYTGQSKYNPPKKPGKIPGSAMDYLPVLEARFDRLETAIDRYVDYRGQRALSNSILPGSEAPSASKNKKQQQQSSSSYYTSTTRSMDGSTR